MNEKQEVKTIKYKKENILRSKRYAKRRDALSFLLEDGKSYSLDEVDKILNTFLKGKVR